MGFMKAAISTGFLRFWEILKGYNAYKALSIHCWQVLTRTGSDRVQDVPWSANGDDLVQSKSSLLAIWPNTRG